MVKRMEAQRRVHEPEAEREQRSPVVLRDSATASEAARRLIDRSVKTHGDPAQVDDEAVLQRVATILRAARREGPVL